MRGTMFKNGRESEAFVEDLEIGATIFWMSCEYVWVKQSRNAWLCISTSRKGDTLSSYTIARDLYEEELEWVIM